MDGNGLRYGEAKARFALRDDVFTVFDALDPEVRAAIHEAPVPFSPLDIANYGRNAGIRGESLAEVVRSQSVKIIEQHKREMGVKHGSLGVRG